MNTALIQTDHSLTEIGDMVEKARFAQRQYEMFSQEAVDGIVCALGKYVYDNAELLARMTVEDTGIGNLQDKIAKNIMKSAVIWDSLKDRKSRGIIGEDPEKAVIYVAKPLGVVGAVTPVTNPVVTPMCNAMFALKCGNAVIFSPHPKGQRCAEHLTAAFREILKERCAMEDLVQVVRNGSIEKTKELMSLVDVVIATGGGPMVKSAYSSGKPAFGVGPGNVPVIVDRDVDLLEAADKIVTGSAFDHGLICSHEQCVFVAEEQFPAAVEAFKATGKVWYSDDPEHIRAFRHTVFQDGKLNPKVIGLSAFRVAQEAGIAISESTRLVVLKVNGPGGSDILCKEKLCPVIGIFPYPDFENALNMAKENLELEGKGHSAVIHSNNEEHIRMAGLALPVSRLVVNQPSSTSAGGSFGNGFAPTTTLGCGSWGGNSISENLSYKHLMNVTRVGSVIKNRKMPRKPQEVWA